MTKYTALAVTTNYWKPQSNYTDKILKAIEKKVENGDFVVVSEKAISTALGNMVDESRVKPSLSARVLVGFGCACLGLSAWDSVRFWATLLLKRLRNYPLSLGAATNKLPCSMLGFGRHLCLVRKVELTAQICPIPM